jgi:hypothetical protein
MQRIPLDSIARIERQTRGAGLDVVSNERFYLRRAAEERLRAARAITEAGRARHAQLASHFASLAQERPSQAVS